VVTLGRHLLLILEKAFVLMTVLFLAAMGTISLVQIFCRYALNHGLVWAFPTVMLLFVWLVFLGAFVIYRRKKDIAVNFIINLFPERWRSKFVFGTNLLVIALLVALLIQFPSIVREQNTQMNIIHLPRYVQSVPLFIGMAFILLDYIIDTVEIAKRVSRKQIKAD